MSVGDRVCLAINPDDTILFDAKGRRSPDAVAVPRYDDA